MNRALHSWGQNQTYQHVVSKSPRRRESVREKKKFEETMLKFFSTSMRNINLQIQETQQTASLINT